MMLIYYCCVLLCNDAVIVYDMFLIFVLYLFTYVCAFAVVLLLLRACVLYCLSESLSCIGGVGGRHKKGLLLQYRHTKVYCNRVGIRELSATGPAHKNVLQRGRHTRAYGNRVGIRELTATGSAHKSLV